MTQNRHHTYKWAFHSFRSIEHGLLLCHGVYREFTIFWPWRDSIEMCKSFKEYELRLKPLFILIKSFPGVNSDQMSQCLSFNRIRRMPKYKFIWILIRHAILLLQRWQFVSERKTIPCCYSQNANVVAIVL